MKINYKFIYIFFLIFFCLYKKDERIRNLIYKSENYIHINYVRSLKKVIYTALFGKYDYIKSINKEYGYDYIMFTDQNISNITTNWTILSIDKNINYSKKFEVMKIQRFYKTHPHIFFKDYDLSIYIDGTIAIKGSLDEFLLRILSKNKSIYTLEHPERISIDNEFGAVLFFQRDSKENIDFVKKRYNREEFPDNIGLSENCLIVRKHNDIKCINFMNQWFYEINHYSYRDQLSFNYILWKTNISIVKYISKNYMFEYFEQNPRHLVKFIVPNI